MPLTQFLVLIVGQDQHDVGPPPFADPGVLDVLVVLLGLAELVHSPARQHRVVTLHERVLVQSLRRAPREDGQPPQTPAQRRQSEGEDDAAAAAPGGVHVTMILLLPRRCRSPVALLPDGRRRLFNNCRRRRTVRGPDTSPAHRDKRNRDLL